MNRETIEKAARDYVKPTAGIIPVAESIAKKEGFIAGAQWRINSVWHEASELPRSLKLIIIEDSNGEFDLGYGITNSTIRWAYIDDLLPDRKEVHP